MSLICEFIFSSCHDCHSSTNGGVMDISNKISVNVICSFFTNNSCTHHGGCFYIFNSSTRILKSIFIGCYSSARSASYRGNAVNIDGNTCNHVIENSATYKCGPSAQESSDTAIFSTGTTKLLLYNATNNYGTQGASGININSGSSQPTAKFITISTGYDTRFYEQAATDINIEKVNFINSTQNNDCLIYSNGCTTTAISCIFSQIDTTETKLSKNNNVIFNSCTIDSSLSSSIQGITVISSIKTFTYSPQIECNIKIQTKSNFSFFYLFQTVLICNSILIISMS